MNHIIKIALITMTGFLWSTVASAGPLFIQTPTQLLKKTMNAHCSVTDNPLASMYVVFEGPQFIPIDIGGSGMVCGPGEVILSKSVSYSGADTSNKKIPLKYAGSSSLASGVTSKTLAFFATSDVDLNSYPCSMPSSEKYYCASSCDEKSVIEFSITCGTVQLIRLEPQETNPPEGNPQSHEPIPWWPKKPTYDSHDR